jgi:hypothetical protein
LQHPILRVTDTEFLEREREKKKSE